jgi:hypothetical protein
LVRPKSRAAQDRPQVEAPASSASIGAHLLRPCNGDLKIV